MAKQYQSIIRLFEHTDISAEGQINLPRAKKQLTAEFDHAAGGIIEINGFPYNKHDVFEELDRPDFNERMKYHRAIWNTPTLLLLLEKNSINIYELNGAMQQFQHDPVFDTFFSPYFVQPFYYVSRTLINESKFDQAAELLLYEDFLQLPEKEEGFKAIRMFFDEQIRTLKNLSPVTYQQGQQKIDNWIYAPWRNFLNALPEEFEPDKIELVFHLVNATVIFQKPNRHLAKSIAFELAEVKGIPSDLMKTINNNRKAFSQSTSSSSGNYGWMIWAGIILVKLISGC